MVINTEIPSSVMYRIDHMTNGPMGLTLLAEDARLCAALCGIHPSPMTSEIGLYIRGPSDAMYRIDHGTNGPMGLTLLAEELGCAALCGIPADGDPTAESAAMDFVGRSDRVALPSVRGIGEGLGHLLSPNSVHSSEVAA